MHQPAASAVYLIFGNHRFLVEEELKKARARVAQSGEAEFNLDLFEAGGDSIDDILQAAETLPFGSERRWVIVKEAQELSAADVKKLARYLEDPSETSTLILAAVGLKAASPLVKAVEKRGGLREVSKRRGQIPGWIRTRFKRRGMQVSGKAIAYMHEALGDDLLAIEAAVEKVSLYHEGGEEVDLGDVVPLVTPSAERSVFELVDRVALGDAEQALKLLRRLLQQGERTTFVLSALARRFRLLLLYRALREEGLREAEMGDRLGLAKNQAWMVAKKLRPQSARLSEEALREALSLLVGVEAGVKTGALEDGFAAEAAVSGLSALAAGRDFAARALWRGD